MTAARWLEPAAAALIIALGIRQYLKRNREGSRRGSQGGVFLLLVGALVAMHALGLFQYRPSQSEIDRQQVQGAG